MNGKSTIGRMGYGIPVLRRLIDHRDNLTRERDNLIAENNALKRRFPEFEGQISVLSSVVNPLHYLDPEWLALHHRLSTYSVDGHCFQNISGAVYRKGWEWTHCLFGLRQLGMLKSTHHGLGVGVGRESVIYYLADHIGRVTATDLYGEAGWSTSGGKEADLALLEASKAHCPASVDVSKISFETQDGTKLTYDDDSFDFAWSLSSIEHFGGHQAAAKALREMARVVRGGGIIAVATEMLMLEEYSHPEYFTRSELMTDLIATCPELELIGPIAFDTLPANYLIDSIVLPQGADRRRRHVVLNDGHVQWTSILLFFRVRDSIAGAQTTEPAS